MGITKVIEIGTIGQFGGAYHFMSNFYVTPIIIKDITYRTSEHAYQAAKFLKDTEERNHVLSFTEPGQAKREANKIVAKLNKYQPESAEPADKADRIAILTPDWENRKMSIMNFVLQTKFAPGSEMAELLLKTGSRPLLEGNWWHDNYWGSCEPKARRTRKTSPCKTECATLGKNHLGRLLMAIRKDLRTE